MTVPFFALLHRTNDGSDCIKTFDNFETQIMVFGNIFGAKFILMNNV